MGWARNMSITKFLAGLTALAVGAAVVTALAGVGPEDKATATTAKTDRIDVATSIPVAASIPACAPEPWPYGCQWRETPGRRPTRIAPR
jgi:hypothetical protein